MSTMHLQPEEITREEFDRLLHWLDPDRDKAGARYEEIRKRLIKIFVCRGSVTPEDLSDKAINRVAHKLAEIETGYVGDPMNYFCGVAHNIFRESLREKRSTFVLYPESVTQEEEEDRDYACLEKCMSKLSPEHRDLVVRYYQQDKRAKIDSRKLLAAAQGMGINALRIRACRIRAALQKCVENCRQEQKNMRVQ